MLGDDRGAVGASLVSLACLTLLAGCGSSSSTTSSAASSTTTSTSISSSPTSTSASTSEAAGAPPAVTPVDAVTDYFAAAKKGDCATAFTYLTDPLKSRLGSQATLCQSLASAPVTDFSTGAAASTGAMSATVPVTLTLSGGSAGTFKDTVTVLQQNGSWFVSSIARK